MRKKLRHKSNIKAKLGLFAATSATILAGIGLPASPVSAKVWSLQEIIENKKVLDAEADRLCTDGEGEDYSVDPLCDKKQYEKFVTVDESDPLRTSDRMLLNQLTKEFAERTFTITYVDPAKLEIKIYFNDRNYTESVERRITGGTTPEYYLSSLEIQWLNDRGGVEFSYANALAITANQEFTVNFGHDMETDPAKVAPRIAYHGKIMSPVNHHTEKFEGEISYLPDGTLLPAEELEPKPTTPGTTTPDGEDHPEGPEPGDDGDDGDDHSSGSESGSDDDHSKEPELGDSGDHSGDSGLDSEDHGDSGSSSSPEPGKTPESAGDLLPSLGDNLASETTPSASDTTNNSSSANSGSQNLQLALSTTQSTNTLPVSTDSSVPKTPNTGHIAEDQGTTTSSTDFLAIAIVAMALGLIKVAIITNWAKRR